MIKRLSVTLLNLGLTALIMAAPLGSGTAQAAVGSNFNASRIIDDQIFFNAGSMTVQQIQDFLVSQVPNCDTGGNLPFYGTYNGVYYNGNVLRKNLDPNFPPPYTCLKDYAENTSTHANNYGGQPIPAGATGASQIILDAAQTYSINPKVLLVLIQKESSLVTDDWPWLNEYTTATGYGCPDTGPNGTANCSANYYGFYNQVTDAAYQFRRYATYPTQYSYVPASQLSGPSNPAGTVNILYHPAPSNCGSTPVAIQNQATAGLYDYTPYVPNQAALNNLYGYGDSCSSYGNRNFWRMFTDWFGSPTLGAPLPDARNSAYAHSACQIPAFSSQYIGRLYQPNVGDYLYTSSASEACAARAYGYIWDGLVFQNYSGANQIPVYRIAGQGRHIFTTDANTRAGYLANPGFVDEGIAFYASSTQAAGLKAVYSTTTDGGNMLTTSAAEDSYYRQDLGYIDRGTVFYSPPVQPTGGVTSVTRLSNSGNYLYSVDPAEIAAAVNQYGFHNEGSTFNESTVAQNDSVPVYRLSNGSSYFYTINRAERDQAVVLYGFNSQGTAFYAPYGGAITIPRFRNALGIRFYTGSSTEASNAKNYGFTFESNGFSGY